MICSQISAKGGFVMNENTDKVIGRNIRKLRLLKGLTQENLATQFQLNGCDITRSAVAKIEAGQRHIYVDEIIILQKK